MTLAKRLEKGSFTFTDGAKPQTGRWSSGLIIAEGLARHQSHQNAEGSAVGWVNLVSLIKRAEHQGDRP